MWWNVSFTSVYIAFTGYFANVRVYIFGTSDLLNLQRGLIYCGLLKLWSGWECVRRDSVVDGDDWTSDGIATRSTILSKEKMIIYFLTDTPFYSFIVICPEVV